MRYLVCYDIADDRRRDKLAKILKDFGPRLQESVFVADLDDALARRLRERVERAVDSGVDRVHVFPLCEACWPKMWTYGLADRPEDPEFYVV